MIADIQLLGVLHNKPEKMKVGQYGMSNILIGPESDKIFSENWFSTFDEKSTLLILESGSFYKEIITSEDEKYEEEIESVSPLLFASDLGPDILCADTRYTDKKSAKRIVEAYFKVLPYMNGTFGFTRIPKTFKEAQERYISGEWRLDISLVNDIPFNIKNLIAESDQRDKEMEEYILTQVEMYKSEYEQILVITGGSHTLEMAAISNLPYQILFDAQEWNVVAQSYADLLLRKAKVIFKC